MLRMCWAAFFPSFPSLVDIPMAAKHAQVQRGGRTFVALVCEHHVQRDGLHVPLRVQLVEATYIETRPPQNTIL